LQEFKDLKELQDEIKHFRNIKVTLEDISQLQKKVEKVRDYPVRAKELEKLYRKIPADEYTRMAKELRSEEDFETTHKKIKIKYVANHYYIPLILSEDEKVDYIKHIIKIPSEVRFINDLEEYLTDTNNRFKNFDWWLFSKLDESLDEVYIPYYDANANKPSKFHPDFIFWLAKGNDYFIVFVDPKGIEHTDWADKVNGYKELFEEKGITKTISSNGLTVKIKLFLRADDAAVVKRRFPEHSPYWFDAIEKILEPVS